MTRSVVNAQEVVTYEAPTADRSKSRILVERDLSGSRLVAVGHLVLPPGGSQPDSSVHPETEEVYHCASGHGQVVLDEKEFPLEAGTAVYVGPRVRHHVFNTGDSEPLMVWFETPPSGEVGGYKPMEQGWKQIAPAQVSTWSDHESLGSTSQDTHG